MGDALGVATATALDSLMAVLADLRDPIGVLSIHVGIDPRAETTARPSWQITIDEELASLRRRLREEGPRERWATFDRCLERLAPELSHLVDTTTHGRGRSLFAAVDSGEVHSITVQAALPTSVTLGEVPHLVPLLALDEGAAEGLVVIGRDTVRVLEWRLGEVAEVASFDVEPVVFDGPERKGPARANPMRATHVIAQRDRYERHLEAEHGRLLRKAAEAVARIGVERGWQTAVVAANPRSGGPVADVLDAAGIEVECIHRDLIELSATQAFVKLLPDLELARCRRDLGLVRRARDAALSGGRGALGAATVLAALADGRVERLLLDGGGDLPGHTGPGGELLPGEGPEPLFGDRVAIRALESGAAVSVVGGDAAAALADCEGIAALLRW